MTHSTAGSITVYSTERFQAGAETQVPPHSSTHEGEDQKYSRWDVAKGNEATYLFFPTAAAFTLVLVSTLSSPIIKGMSLADIKPTGELGGGVIRFGSWGWCSTGVQGVTDGCSRLRPLGGQMSTALKGLPRGLMVLHSLDNMLPKAFNAAGDAFTVIACVIAWWSLGTCLAAAGEWGRQQQKAHRWARWTYWFTFISFILTAIEFGLDIRKYTLIANAAIGVQAALPVVSVGPVIWLKMAALILNLGCCLSRLLWLKSHPRAEWTMTTPAQEIRHSSTAASSDEMPPTWETLDIKDAAAIDDKMFMPRDSVVIHEVPSPDFTAPPRLPAGRGGAI